MANDSLNENIHYLSGQIDALTALVLAIADSTMDKDTFRQQSAKRLDTVQTMLLSMDVPEARLQGVENMRQWLLAVTG